MKKLADIIDKNRTPTNKGDYVFFSYGNGKSIKKILGKIVRINGAYVSVQRLDNEKEVWELYSIELEKASDNEAMLWMLEN